MSLLLLSCKPKDVAISSAATNAPLTCLEFNISFIFSKPNAVSILGINSIALFLIFFYFNFFFLINKSICFLVFTLGRRITSKFFVIEASRSFKPSLVSNGLILTATTLHSFHFLKC